MMKMIDIMGTKSIEEITADPDVKERLDRYKEHQIKFHAMMRDHSKMYGDCVVTDLRNLIVTATGNRFLIYTIFPESNISLRIIDGKNKENVVFAVGHSILNRTSKVNVGALLSQYGGGGHVGAGTCQVPYADADKVLAEIIEKMNNA
jgi:nanoRNase/pAp phosphatase (c-di-AMP/oligoRNAs hydrolase)